MPNRSTWIRLIVRHVLVLIGTILLGGLLSATLVRLAPGADSDERLLDSRLNADSANAIRASRAEEHNLLRFYSQYLWRALHGDLGTSRSLAQPVGKLFRDRIPVTFRLVGAGLLWGWWLALALALLVAALQIPAWDIAATAATGALLCLPGAVLALLSVLWNWPASLAIALIVFAKLYRYSRNLLGRAYASPHIVMARAKGLGNAQILFWHALPVAGPQLLALAGVSVSIALGAAIPIEALCGLPGIGQLAWQAALGRDLPLLLNITVLVTFVTLLGNSGADVMSHVFRKV